jgi:hypothetical protein
MCAARRIRTVLGSNSVGLIFCLSQLAHIEPDRDICPGRYQECNANRDDRVPKVLAQFINPRGRSGEPQRELPNWTDIAIDKVLQRVRNVVAIDIAAALDFASDVI